MARTSARRPGELAALVVRAGRRPRAIRALLLDLDGTLAPLAPTPGQARVPRVTLDALRRLGALGWTVAVVSGRPAAQVRRMVPVRHVRVFGSHGLEGSWGEKASGRLPADLRRRLEGLSRRARSLVSGTPGARLERKPAGLAFHDRGVAARDLRAWRTRLGAWLESEDLSDFETLRGHRVLELRPRGVHKGRVARRVVRRLARPRDDSLVAVGDDRTDEDLFHEIGTRGLTIRVGRPGIETCARARLPSPDAVRRFLEAVADLDSGAQSPRAARALS